MTNAGAFLRARRQAGRQQITSIADIAPQVTEHTEPVVDTPRTLPMFREARDGVV